MLKFVFQNNEFILSHFGEIEEFLLHEEKSRKKTHNWMIGFLTVYQQKIHAKYI